MEKVGIVILNWNGVKWLDKFLPTLVENSLPHDVIVIDNASTDDSVTLLKEKFPSVIYVINEKNYGYSGGYNAGLQQLRGAYDYYILINSDVEVTKDWIAPLLQITKEKNNVFAVQPKVLSFDKKDYFEYAGAAGGFVDKNFYPFCRGRIFSTLEKDQQHYDNTKQVFWASGACMLVNAKAFHALNGFDNDFFAHMEEIDLCWRAQRAGFTNWCCSKSVVYHVGGGTLAYNHPNKTFLNFRNSLYMIHKNYEGFLFPKIVKRLFLDGIAGIKFLLELKFNHFFAILRAHWCYYKNIKTLRKKRKEINTINKTTLVGVFQGSILYNYFIKKNKQFVDINKRKFS